MSPAQKKHQALQEALIVVMVLVVAIASIYFTALVEQRREMRCYQAMQRAIQESGIVWEQAMPEDPTEPQPQENTEL